MLSKTKSYIFAFFFLATALSAGFIHNHSDDPFHTTEHNDCPVSVWAHTPISLVAPFAFDLFVAILAGAVILALSDPFLANLFLTRSPRGPPIVLS